MEGTLASAVDKKIPAGHALRPLWAEVRPLLSALDAADWPADKEEQLALVGRSDAGQLCAFISVGARGRSEAHSACR